MREAPPHRGGEVAGAWMGRSLCKITILPFHQAVPPLTSHEDAVLHSTVLFQPLDCA